MVINNLIEIAPNEYENGRIIFDCDCVRKEMINGKLLAPKLKSKPYIRKYYINDYLLC